LAAFGSDLQQIAAADAELLPYTLRNDHLVFIFDGNNGHWLFHDYSKGGERLNRSTSACRIADGWNRSSRKVQGLIVHAGLPDVGKDDVRLDQIAGQGLLAVRYGFGELLTAGKPEQGIGHR